MTLITGARPNELLAGANHPPAAGSSKRTIIGLSLANEEREQELFYPRTVSLLLRSLIAAAAVVVVDELRVLCVCVAINNLTGKSCSQASSNWGPTIV